MPFVPAVLTYPNNAGPRASWGHLEIKLAGFPGIGIKTANYSRKRSVESVYGSSPDPLGNTQGINEYECDIEIYEEEFRVLLSVLNTAAKAIGLGLGDYAFPITATYNVPGFGTVTDTILGNRITEQSSSNSQGPGALARKLAFKPTKILFNGIDDVTTPLAQLAIYQSIVSAA